MKFLCQKYPFFAFSTFSLSRVFLVHCVVCFSIWLLLLSLIGLPACYAQSSSLTSHLKLWYTQPAQIWEEALPLGNGKTGAMVFGRVNHERFQLNDNTLWSGYPIEGNNPNGPTVLPQVRKAISEGEYDKADALWKKMQGPYCARYLPMGDLHLDFGFRDSAATNYYRELDLNRAISTVKYTVDGVTYTRETFISHPASVMVVRVSANKKNHINVDAILSSKLKFSILNVALNQLVLKGKAPKHVAHRASEPQQIVYDEDLKGEGTNFEIHLSAQSEGGKVTSQNGKLTISGANTVTFYVVGATSFNGFDKSPGLAGKDPSAEANTILRKALSSTYAQLKAAHIADYQKLFNRVVLDLGVDAEALKLPTDERLIRQQNGPSDTQLQTLYYQFGRYLLILSSRNGASGAVGIPANLQGIWNDHIQPPWGSNYTTNINVEMNYWLAENANLPECHLPLLHFIGNLAVNGAKTAKVNYGINEGWITHHGTDIWAKTSAGGGYEWDSRSRGSWSSWLMAGAWLSTHLWEHYQFTGDKTFLRAQGYPLMKSAAQFMLHWLVEDGQGHLITNPSTSPENTIKISGKEYQITMASTMDMAIIRELFNDCIQAAKILETDAPFIAQLEKTKAQLYPYQIGQFGQLQEWYKDWDDPNDKHRHISHLFGLHPGHQINPRNTPELAAAAKKTLIQRGDVSTGWSMAWKINWWARLEDGNHAYKILRDGLSYVGPKSASRNGASLSTQSGGGTYPNLFDAHPPFQIDGNFGGTAGITEMLLQSHTGEISLLPALPDAWPKGTVKGIKARGNFDINIAWEQGKLTQASVLSNLGGVCRLRTKVPVKVVEIPSLPNQSVAFNPLNPEVETLKFVKKPEAVFVDVPLEQSYLIEFQTEKGKRYTILPQK